MLIMSGGGRVSNLVKDEAIYIRIYTTEPSSTPAVSDVVDTSAGAILISSPGRGLQQFNVNKTAETRENTGRSGYRHMETQGMIDYDVDFQVDWVDATDGLLDAETKYLMFVRREKGTASGRTQQLGGGPITQCNLVDRDGGWAFDVTVDGDVALARSNQS